MKPQEIRALIQLLDDPDDQIFEMVAENLRTSDTSVVPYLEEAWANSPDLLFQDRIEVLIHDIQFREVSVRLNDWYHQPDNDLLEGVFWLARYQYPDLRMEDISREIRNIARDLWLELQENLTALEKVRILNHILFEVHRFSANYTQFYSPRNNYINTVLESKKGNPISLSVLYSLVAREVHMPVLGVNLPKNFIVAYRDEYRSDETYDPDLDDHILFYINPYNRGAVLGRAELDLFLKQQGLDPRKEFFIPCSNNQIIDRLLNNLIFSYQKMGNAEKARELEELSGLLQKKPDRLE